MAFPAARSALERGMRAISALLLSLVLAIASVSMAVARGQVPMGSTIALCTEAGAVSVVLDAEGNPTKTPPHLCPECLSAATVFDLPYPASLAAPRLLAQVLVLTDRALILARTHVVSPHARGPPTLSV